MTLHKAMDDEWTSTGVKSKFKLTIPDDPSLATDSMSEVCGWGWRFRFDIGPELRTTSPRVLAANSSIIPWRRISVHFDPHLVRGAAYGRITFQTAVDNLVRLEDEPPDPPIDLPDDSGYNYSLGVYMRRGDMDGVPSMTISVQFAAALGMALPLPRNSRVEAALAETIRGEETVDIKFYAYTRIGVDYASRPQTMFAKTTLMMGHSDALDDYISGGAGFAESKMVDLNVDGSPDERFAEYDYMSDSDLDPESEDEDGGVHVDQVASSSENSDSHSLISRPSIDPAPSPQASVSRRMGRVLVVKGYAFKTWNAFLYYLYTGKLVFRPPGSRVPVNTTPLIPECSAKSMYKLADAFGLDDLKSLAFRSLHSQLSAENIVREAFSSFTALYPEVQDVEVEVLMAHLPNLKQQLSNMLRTACDGSRPHASSILEKIIYRTEFQSAPVSVDSPPRRKGRRY
ncbi:hypothetical protein B0H16DRAFT_1560345 [Mycena metata]|uniref:BTB domain-containing protein n=1 Tax=Mycena metata TaxID=1033252 RepID=A0AAD7IIU8_9AGAR|nr:hypothetical protein B0H16DRAFT_1560345 [Mycena metata]